MDATKPYEFVWFGDIHGPKPYKNGLSVGMSFVWGGESYPLPCIGARGPEHFYKGRQTL